MYLTNVEGICSRFMEEKRDELQALSARASDLRAFWAACTCAHLLPALQAVTATCGQWRMTLNEEHRARFDDAHRVVRRVA